MNTIRLTDTDGEQIHFRLDSVVAIAVAADPYSTENRVLKFTFVGGSQTTTKVRMWDADRILAIYCAGAACVDLQAQA